MALPTTTELTVFMAAIRRLESGSYEGNYSALGPATTSGNQARGAYQIMSQYWDGWAAEAGIAGADWRDPKAQDYVARYKFNKYYQEFGDWRLVAIAWFAGGSRARAAQRDGVQSLASLSDSIGTSVPKYVELIDKYMGEYADSAGFSAAAAQAAPGFLPGDAAAVAKAKTAVQPAQQDPTKTVMASRTPTGGAKAGSPGALGATPLDVTDPSLTMRSNLRNLLIGISDAIKASSTNPLLVDNPAVLGEGEEDKEETGLI